MAEEIKTACETVLQGHIRDQEQYVLSSKFPGRGEKVDKWVVKKKHI